MYDFRIGQYAVITRLCRRRQTHPILGIATVADKKVALAKMESDFFGKNYDVIFVNGDKVEFDRSGNWEKIKCKYSQVPASLIPNQIMVYVRNNYPDSKIIELEKERNTYEAKLSNGWELKFNKNFELIDLDK